MPISLQPEAASYIPASLQTDHCGDRVWQPTLWDWRRECYCFWYRWISPIAAHTHMRSSNDALLISFLTLSGNSWIWSVDMKDPTKRHFLRRDRPPLPNSSSSSPPSSTKGSGGVNTNKWCPTPSAMKCINWSCSLLLWRDTAAERRRRRSELVRSQTSQCWWATERQEKKKGLSEHWWGLGRVRVEVKKE